MHVERRLEEIERRLDDQKHLLDSLAEYNSELVRHRECLFAALSDITERFRAMAGKTPDVIAAERVLQDIGADGFYDEIPPWLERKHIDRWIDAFGMAPPGVVVG